MRNTLPAVPPRNKLYGAPRRYSPITKAPKGMLDRSEDDPVKLRWYAGNCDKLADFMEALQPQRHAQGYWNVQNTSQAKRNECGTAACALGWATLSQIIPGLQYTIDMEALKNDWTDLAQPFEPTINGVKSHYGAAGVAFFGWPVQYEVFNRGHLSKAEVINRLRERAEEYRRQAS